MQIWGRTQPLSDVAIEKALEELRGVGFEGVEVCLENPDLAPETLDKARAESIRDKIADLGFSGHSVSYHKNYIYDDNELELSLKAVELTPAFGADIFVFAGGWPKDETPEKAWDRLIERTRPLLEMAERCGVTLAKEFEPGFVCRSTADLHRLFEALPSERLAANLDIGHVFLCDQQPLEAIGSLKGKIVHCHVENMETNVHQHRLPWEGDMDLRAYLAALAEAGFDGGMALDLYKLDYLGVAPRCIEFLKDCMPEK